MSFFDVFSEMLVILFCMAAGLLAHKLGYLSKQTDQNLCRLLLGIIVPCLILGSVSSGDALPGTGEILSVLKVAIVYYGLGFFVAAFVPRLLGGTVKQQCVWRYSLIFSNMAFIGYPVSSLFVLRPEGVDEHITLVVERQRRFAVFIRV